MSFTGNHGRAEAPASGLPDFSGILVRTSEIAALRLNPRHGVEGNEVLFRSGVTVTLSYEIARGLAEKLRDAGGLCQGAGACASGHGTSHTGPLIHIPGK